MIYTLRLRLTTNFPAYIGFDVGLRLHFKFGQHILPHYFIQEKTQNMRYNNKNNFVGLCKERKPKRPNLERKRPKPEITV